MTKGAASGKAEIKTPVLRKWYKVAGIEKKLGIYDLAQFTAKV
jgi:hypothetical protein